eukprot:6284534-Pyramimonas_sp.AAC.1
MAAGPKAREPLWGGNTPIGDIGTQRCRTLSGCNIRVLRKPLSDISTRPEAGGGTRGRHMSSCRQRWPRSRTPGGNVGSGAISTQSVKFRCEPTV